MTNIKKNTLITIAFNTICCENTEELKFKRKCKEFSVKVAVIGTKVKTPSENTSAKNLKLVQLRYSLKNSPRISRIQLTK